MVKSRRFCPGETTGKTTTPRSTTPPPVGKRVLRIKRRSFLRALTAGASLSTEKKAIYTSSIATVLSSGP